MVYPATGLKRTIGDEPTVCVRFVLTCRGWVINPGDVTYYWLIPFAIIPAILGTILIFLDQQITSVIVNRKEHKLKVSGFPPFCHISFQPCVSVGKRLWTL